MRQTTFRTKSDNSGECIAIPLGIVRLVRSNFNRYRFYELLDGFKDKGVPLSLVVENMCVNSLTGDYSMNDWDKKIHRSPLKEEYLCKGHRIKRWTLQKDLDRLGLYLEEIVDHICKVTRFLFPDDSTHTYVDGTHIRRYGPAGRNVKYGEGGGTIQLQDQFMVSSSILSGIPISIELYPGNMNDPQQYCDFIPQLLFFLKRGSLIVMDNGGSSGKILNEIVNWGDEYITRVRINQSDEETIENDLSGMEYLGMGTCCLTHTFESSKRTNYLFFSVDSYVASVSRAMRAVEQMDSDRIKAQKVLMSTNTRGLYTTIQNPYFRVEIADASIIMTDDPWMEIDVDKELAEAIPTKGGWFKLQSSLNLDPLLVLLIYRHRVDIEHMISSIKSVINTDPMRVWGEGSTRGKLIVALICQFIISSTMNDMEAKEESKVVDGKMIKVRKRCSPKTFVEELKTFQGVLMRDDWGGISVKEMHDPYAAADIMPVIKRYESEGALDLDSVKDFITKPAAQWDCEAKNCENLAQSIAQEFSKTIFSEQMVSRMRLKAMMESISEVKSGVK